MAEVGNIRELGFWYIGLDEEMDISKRSIKEHCLTTTAVCLTCHRRFEMDKIKRHVQNIHRGEDTSFCDQIVKLSTIKNVTWNLQTRKTLQ